MFVGKKKAERLVGEALVTHRQMLNTTLRELAFENYKFLGEFGEVAQLVVSESSAKLGTTEAEMLLGTGPNQRKIVRLMNELEWSTKRALQARERQQHLSARWLAFHSTAAVTGLLWVTIATRAYIRDFKLDRSHPLFSLYEKGTEVLRALCEYGSKRIDKDQAIARLAGC